MQKLTCETEEDGEKDQENINEYTSSPMARMRSVGCSYGSEVFFMQN